MRLTHEELEEVKKKYGVSELWSWSKVNTFMTSPYEFYLSYVLHKKPDKDNCAYAPLGGICHSIIEDLYSNKIEYEEMSDLFEDGWTTAIDIAQLYFSRSDESKNESIGKKYKDNLQHFFANHKKIENKIELERFLTAKIGDYVLQGYADAITKDEDDNFVIIDWKTSSIYKGKTADEKCGQLVVYALALNQLGIPMDKIRICWNFLKYCNVEVTQKNGKKKLRTLERYNLGESLCTNAKMWLKDSGYDEDETDIYLKQLIDCNSIDCLPVEVQEKFTISDAYVYVDLTEKLVNNWIGTISTTIKDIELRVADYNETKSEMCFWDSEESVKSQSYYMANLMGYSPNLHKPYGQYLDKLEQQKNGTNMFSGLLNDSITTSTSNVIDNKSEDLDLSWLDSI